MSSSWYGLGWSEPSSMTSSWFGWRKEYTPQCPSSTLTHGICIVSPQDDWVLSQCGCTHVLMDGERVECTTQSGRQGAYVCCPPGCPTVSQGAASQGVTRQQASESVGGVVVAQQVESGVQQAEGALISSASGGWVPWAIVGGVAFLGLAGAVAMWMTRGGR